jgi:hypothetical protein
VGRSDLIDGFGISPAQASGDLQRYAEMNAGAMIYQTSRKRYEGQERMRCLLHEPSLEEAAAVLGGGAWSGELLRRSEAGSAAGKGVFERLVLPTRVALADVSRKVVVALMGRRQVEVKYHSLNSGTSEWRVLRPGALGSDGRRWHLRAWCGKREDWRDFVIGRISEAKWPEEGEVDVPRDEAWEAWETVVLRINPKLKERERESLRLDYGMDGDELRVSVRRAMKGYFLAEMFIDAEKGKELPRHFVVGGGPD